MEKLSEWIIQSSPKFSTQLKPKDRETRLEINKQRLLYYGELTGIIPHEYIELYNKLKNNKIHPAECKEQLQRLTGVINGLRKPAFGRDFEEFASTKNAISLEIFYIAYKWKLV